MTAQRSQHPQQPPPQGTAVGSTWRDQCRFALILQGGKAVELSPCTDAGRNSRKSAIEATVREVLHSGCKLLPSIPSFVKKRLASLDSMLDPSAAPFSAEPDEMLRQYADVWSRVMLFLVRAHEQLESEAQTQAVGSLPAWRGLQALSVEQLSSVASLSSSDAATRRIAVLLVSRYCIEQQLQGDGQESALMVAFACLCIRGNGEWLPGAGFIVKRLLYCSRLFSLLIQLAHHQLWDPATLTWTARSEDSAAKAYCFEGFEDRQIQTLSRTSGTAVPRLALLGSWRAPAAPALAAPTQAEASGSTSRPTGIIENSSRLLYPASSSQPAAQPAARPEQRREAIVQRPPVAAPRPPPAPAQQSQAGPSTIQLSSEEEDELEESYVPRRPAQGAIQKRLRARISERARKRRREAPGISDDDDLPIFISANFAGNVSGAG